MKEERYNQIIDEAYENYRNKRTTANKDNVREPHTLRNGMTGEISRPFTKEEFVDKCKADSDFSGKWGLKIEERELSLEESDDLKLKLILEYLNEKGIITPSFDDFKKDEDKIPSIDWRREVMGLIGWIDYGNELNRNRLQEIYDDIQNIPTKLITLTYNNEINETYE